VSSRLPRLFTFRRLIILFVSLTLASFTQQGNAEKVSTEEWNISADNVVHYDNPNSIVAKGNVILKKKKQLPLHPPKVKPVVTSWSELLEEEAELPETTADEISDKSETVYKTTVTIKADWMVYDVELESIKAKGSY